MAELPEVHRPRNRPQWIVGLVLAGFLLLALTHGSYRFGVVTTMIMTIIVLSLVVLTGMVGQISLAQAAFVGSAGFVLAKLGTKLPVPDQHPRRRPRCGRARRADRHPRRCASAGAQLAVVTLAGAIAIEKFVFRNPKLVGTERRQHPQPQAVRAPTSRCVPGRTSPGCRSASSSSSC